MAECNTDTLFSEACESGFKPGISDDLYRALVLQLLCNIVASGGGGGGSSNLSGSGSPVGVVTPTAVNQFYSDETNDVLWQARGLTSADWFQWI